MTIWSVFRQSLADIITITTPGRTARRRDASRRQEANGMTDTMSTAPQTELKKGAVGLWEGVFQSFSFVGPAGDVAILLVGTAAFALGATPLAVLIAWIIYGIWMVVPTEFSTEIVNAGSYYAYSARGLKGGGGVLAVWYWMGENLTGPAFAVLGLSSFVYLLSSTLSGSGWLWAPIAVATLLFGVVLSYLGIKPSLVYTMWAGFLEVAFLLVTAIVIVVMVGHGNSGAPFTLHPLHGDLHPLFLGVIFSVLDFTGLGTATTIAEETKDSKRLIRKAIIVAWVLAGLALVLPSYALTVGWGVDKMAGYAKSADPGLIVYLHYLGRAGWVLLIIFTINSYLMYMVAKVNAVTRIWFSAGRDGVLFKPLARVHPKFRTPHLLVAFFFLIIVTIDLITGFILGPETAALWLLTISGICIIGVHIVANTSLTVYMWRARKFKAVLHGVLPSAATIMGLIVLWYSVYPVPAAPIGYAVIIALAWLVVGFGVTWYYVKRHPGLMRVAGLSRE
jgi:amino acid transporter